MKRSPTAFDLEKQDGYDSASSESVDAIKTREKKSQKRKPAISIVFWLAIFFLGYYIGIVFPWVSETFLFHSNLQVAGGFTILVASVFAQGLMASGTKMTLPAAAYSGGNKLITDDISNFRSRMFTTSAFIYFAVWVIGILFVAFG